LVNPVSTAIPGKRAQTKEHNRRIILDAARRVFAELGYGPSTVRDIIRATTLASGTFYNYFKSKEDVFLALREETAAALKPRLREQRKEARTAEAFISATFASFFSFAAAEQYRLAAINGDTFHVHADTLDVVAGFAELREDIEHAIHRGLFPALDSEFLAAAIIGVAFEISRVMQKRERQDVEAATQFATGLVLGRIATASTRGSVEPDRA